MNALFLVLFALCSAVMLIFSPNDFLPALLSGGEKAITLSVSLVAIYAVWMGFAEVLEKSSVSEKFARLISPLCRRLFKTDDSSTISDLGMNVVANMLGLGGVATPYGVSAIEKMDKKSNEFGQDMLFAINATSVQILPTTVISLEIAFGAQNAYDIFLPSLVCSLFCTCLACIMMIIYYKIRSKREKL